MRHGADPFHVQLSRKTLDTIRINAVRLAQQKSSRTGVGLSRASTSLESAVKKTWMAGINPAMTMRCPMNTVSNLPDIPLPSGIRSRLGEGLNVFCLT